MPLQKLDKVERVERAKRAERPDRIVVSGHWRDMTVYRFLIILFQ
jgi:hypothetical protein